MQRNLIAAMAVLSSAAVLPALGATLSFDTNTEYSANFRSGATAPASAPTFPTSGGNPGTGGYVNFSDTVSGGQRFAQVYDITPGDGNTTVNTFGGGSATAGEIYSIDFRIDEYPDAGGLTARMTTASTGYVAFFNVDDGDFRLQLGEVTSDYGRVVGAAASSVLVFGDGTFPNELSEDVWYRLELKVQNDTTEVDLTATLYDATARRRCSPSRRRIQPVRYSSPASMAYGSRPMVLLIKA